LIHKDRLAPLENAPFSTYLVASILSGGARGQREVTWRATPFGVPSRPMHRGVKGR
jgi:hypothetical protein